MLILHKYKENGFSHEVWEFKTDDNKLFITNSSFNGGYIYMKQCKDIEEFKTYSASNSEKKFMSLMCFDENEWMIFKSLISKIICTHGGN